MINFKILTLFLAIAFLFFQTSFAYVQGKGSNGSVIKWKNTSTKTLYVVTANNQGMSSAQVFDIVSSSVAAWNATSPLKIVPVLSSSIVSGANNFYFASGASSAFSGLGVGVLGITQTLYDASGYIAKGDIIINDSFHFEASDVSDDNYLGNVITHELGHFLGLAHSEVKDSTMIYTALRGQNTLAHDDEAGIYSLYPSGGKGSISGSVIGGDDLIGVLASHVQAISRSTGKVYAGVYSDADGSFSVQGLPLNDSYYLYVSPAEMITQVPAYYADAKKNFCSSSANYRGDFFQSCQSSDEGYPQEIPLTSSNTNFNVGLVSIHCNLASPRDYLAQKPFESNYFSMTETSKAFTGFFTQGEIEAGTATDVFHIDLSNHALIGSEYLEIKTLSQGLFSKLLFKVFVKSLDSSERTFSYTPTLDADGNMNGDSFLRIPLDPIAANNIYEVRIVPIIPSSNSSSWNISGTNYSLDQLFPNYDVKTENLRFYLLNYNITRLSGGSYLPTAFAQANSVEGNNLCPDAPRTYKVLGTTETQAFKTSRKSKKADESPIACGTIGPKGGNQGGGSGPLMLILGLGLTFLMRFLLSTKRPWIPARPIS